MDQSTIDEAVKIATRSALYGHPVSSITWIPPATASSDPRGSFLIEDYRYSSAAETPPWEG